MALVRDSDTSLWLHNKLGTSDSWSGPGSICSQLNSDVLRNTKHCFIDLQAQVKLKLLLSFLHIPRRNVEEWKIELEDILELATMDSDQWVSMLAELLKEYPSTGKINLDIEDNAQVFTHLVEELRKHVKKTNEPGMIPMECLYLNKNALSTIVGQQAQPAKHFTLKRKPKSAALRADLLQKSSDAANNMKKNIVSCGVPIRSRSLAKRMDDTTPLKGLPSRTPTNSFRGAPLGIRRLSSISLPTRPAPKTPAGRKDGGIKFLEITEQPIGFGREAKRRKKLLEGAEAEAAKKEKEATAGSSPTAASTPEYAAGLLAPIISTPQSATSAAPLTPMPVAHPSHIASSPVMSAPSSSAVPSVCATPPTSSPITTAETSSPSSSAIVAVTPATSTTAAAVLRENVPAAQPTIKTVPSVVASSASVIPTTSEEASPEKLTSTPTPMFVTSSAQPVSAQVTIITQPQTQKKGLSLTREQMQEAQEMFRTANKVTRPEKALILGFMAGARDNPCPHLGNVVTIKLSESAENLKQPDGSLLAVVIEMHFQMNYNTGEWKRVRKIRKVDD